MYPWRVVLAPRPGEAASTFVPLRVMGALSGASHDRTNGHAPFPALAPRRR